MLEQFIEGAMLMLIGMGSVFVFLLLLVYTMKAMSWLTEQFEFEQPSLPLTESSVDHQNDIAAVIAAAVSTYRRNHTQKTGRHYDE